MRLRRRAEFAALRAEGERWTSGCMILNLRRLGPGCPSRLGVITSRRVGPAVARNRARRLLREVFRLHRAEFRQPLDLVLVARPSIGGKAYQQVERDFLTGLRRGRLLIEG